MNIIDEEIASRLATLELTVSQLAREVLRIFPEEERNPLFMMKVLRQILNLSLREASIICGWSIYGMELSDEQIDLLRKV